VQSMLLRVRHCGVEQHGQECFLEVCVQLAGSTEGPAAQQVVVTDNRTCVHTAAAQARQVLVTNHTSHCPLPSTIHVTSSPCLSSWPLTGLHHPAAPCALPPTGCAQRPAGLVCQSVLSAQTQGCAPGPAGRVESTAEGLAWASSYLAWTRLSAAMHPKYSVPICRTRGSHEVEPHASK
jgi:hypothetical protein